MGMEGLAFGGVTAFLSEFFGNGLVSNGLTALMALGIGAFGLRAIIKAFQGH